MITLVFAGMAWRARRRWTVLPILAALVLSLGATVIAGGVFWYSNRPQPAPVTRLLFDGVTYIREVRDDPRPMVIHVVMIDLDAPGIGFLVTPHTPTADRVQAARTTSGFLNEFDLQLAINGDFFAPWRDNGPWDYYPHSGDPVDVRGIAAAQGDVYTRGFVNNSRDTLYISADNQASIGAPIGTVYNAISGFTRLVRSGEAWLPRNGNTAYWTQPQPRTAIAVDQSGETLLFVLVDGRQPNYSEGATMPELAQIIISYGGWDALNLDGGGSTTLAAEVNGRPQVLNSPIHNRWPGRERPIPNHLGVYAGVLGG